MLHDLASKPPSQASNAWLQETPATLAVPTPRTFVGPAAGPLKNRNHSLPLEPTVDPIMLRDLASQPPPKSSNAWLCVVVVVAVTAGEASATLLQYPNSAFAFARTQ